MSYQYPSYQNTHPNGFAPQQQYPSQEQYGQPQGEYTNTPANGFSAGDSSYQPGRSSYIQPNGPSDTDPNLALQSPSSIYTASSYSTASHTQPQYSYNNLNSQFSQAYNPQAYAQSNTNTASYAQPHRPPMPTQTSYNPAAYAQAQMPFDADRQSSLQSRWSYNPSDYSVSLYSGTSRMGSLVSNQSPPLAQNHFANSNMMSPTYDAHSSMPPPVPPRPYQTSQVQYPSYSTYGPPAPQHATTYVQPMYNPPYPDANSSAVPIPSQDFTPEFNDQFDLPEDELNLPALPPYSRHDENCRDSQRPPSISPMHSPDNPDAMHGPPPTPPAHGVSQSSSPIRHPQSRPLPGPPQSDDIISGFRPPLRADTMDYSAEHQDELFNELESAIMNVSSPVNAGATPTQRSARFPTVPARRPLFGSHRRREESPATHSRSSMDASGDSDAEALAGLEAMRIADEKEAADIRKRKSAGNFLGTPQKAEDGDSDGENYANVDMGLYEGGHQGTVSYGDADALAGASQSSVSNSSSLRQRPGLRDRGMSYDSTKDVIRPSTAFLPPARVDSGGTGGLVNPSTDLQDENGDDADAYSFTEDTIETSGPPDLFFMPDTTSLYRPLPPPPQESPDGVSPNALTSRPAPSASHPVLSSSTSMRALNSTDVSVPRFASLRELNPPSPVIKPVRSKTDAEDRQRKPGLITSFEQQSVAHGALPATPSANTMTLDLPSLPSKRFNASKLGASDFRKCEEPWALSAIHRWIRTVANPDQVTELKESMIREALVNLFTNKVPTMNITDSENLAQRVIREMYDAGTLRQTEEWVRLVPGSMSGVIFQLTRGGCYAPKLHEHVIQGRCYSHFCQRTLKKVNLLTMPSRANEDWATFYKLKKEDVAGVDKKEIERQNILHEIVQTEDHFMEQINVLQQVYRNALQTAEPPVIDPKRINAFIREVFGKIDAVRKANEDHLLAQLKYRQNEQGPFIQGFNDIFRQWIRKAGPAYIEYAAGFPAAALAVRQEQERNIEFKAFLDRARTNKASNRLGLDTYLKSPITRLQRYSLLLTTVHKCMIAESDEKKNLQLAIDEIKKVTKDCDDRVAEMQRKVDLTDLSQKLLLREGMQREVELNLNHLGRQLVHQGSLLRTGSKKFNWVDCHALLFDHYFILAKAFSVEQRGTGVRIDKFDVSRFPIPMDLLVLEGFDDDPVRQSHYARGLTSVTTSVPRGISASDLTRVRSGTVTSPAPTMDRSNTAASGTSINSTASAPPVTTILDGGKESEKILYPFRVKHLGRETYTLFAQSAPQRSEWKAKLIEAKSTHAKSLYRQNAEPFRMRVLADAAFHYQDPNSHAARPIIIDDTPMSRAIAEVEERFQGKVRPRPICHARVNCSTTFRASPESEQLIAVGTDFGVYLSELDNPRGWRRVITMTNVIQVAVLEEFNVFLLISNRALIVYSLDTVLLPSSNPAANDSSIRSAPQKLSGSRDVSFFNVGRMKDRTLVFYKKRDSLSSRFKILEPVYQKSSERTRRGANAHGLFRRGNTELFRDFDEFYIPTECSGMNLFTSSLSVSTSKGFEILTLDKKQTFSVPDLRGQEVALIAQHVEGQATLCMLRLSEQEFLCCYEKCAVYVNKHGEVSRSVVMNFVGRAKAAALHGPYLVLFDQDFVEVRNAMDGRLKQVIAGKDVRCLDDGGASRGPIRLAMAHPSVERSQVVLEMVLNEDLRDNKGRS